MLNAWSIWWNADRLTHSFEDYWNAPIFAPQTGTFALSEPQPVTLIVAPVLWLFSLPAAYNTYLCLAIALNGLLSYGILRQCGADRLCAIGGGVAMSLHPLGLQNLEAIQLLPLWGILGVVWLVIRISRRPSWLAAAGISFALMVAATTCLHHTLFFAMLLPFSVAAILPLRMESLHRRLRRYDEPAAATQAEAKQSRESEGRVEISGLGVFQILCGLAVGFCLALPLILPMQRIHSVYDLQRDPDTVRLLSASPQQWLSAPGFFSRGEATPTTELPLLPGLLRSSLAALSLLFLNSRNQLPIRFLISMAVTSFILSLGLNLNIFGWHPWDSLCTWLTPLARVRSPYRFAYFTQLAIILLASLTVNELREKLLRLPASQKGQPLSSRPTNHAGLDFWRDTGLFAMCGLMFCLAFEVVPHRSYIIRPPGNVQSNDWTEFIRQHASEDDILLCLPVSATMAESDLETATRWMMYATAHHRPIMNGYSGYFPKPWISLWDRLRSQPLEPKQIAQLREMGTRWIVVQKAAYSSDLRALETVLRPAYEDAYFQVYDLRP